MNLKQPSIAPEKILTKSTTQNAAEATEQSAALTKGTGSQTRHSASGEQIPKTNNANANRKNNKNKKRDRQSNRSKEPKPVIIAPAATPAKMRNRHWVVLFSFVLLTLIPSGIVYGYLWHFAADQYSSSLGFSVRSEEASTSLDVMGAITGSSLAATKDTDIIYKFLQSQNLVATLDDQLDLRGKWSAPKTDPFFAFDPSGTIEDLQSYWGRMVKTDYEPTTGLMEIKVLAFKPKDSLDIAEAILSAVSDKINDISAVASEGTTQFAREELGIAENRLKAARLAINSFRERTQIIDPTATVQGQNLLLNNLNSQLAGALIEMDLLIAKTASKEDPRVTEILNKVDAIQSRIAKEREKISTNDDTYQSYSRLVSDYESLVVEREFAEAAYLSSLATFEGSISEAGRQSRYIAAYAMPRLAERSEYPQRTEILLLFAFFNLLIWAIGVLIFYSVRDRR